MRTNDYIASITEHCSSDCGGAQNVSGRSQNITGIILPESWLLIGEDLCRLEVVRDLAHSSS